MTAVALHGFLGKPSDWEMIDKKEFPVHWISYPIKAEESLEKWAFVLNQWAETLPMPRFLFGYSMGGRLALHALLQNPKIWRGTCLLSTHLGIEKIDERKARYIRDCDWAERFLADPWKELMVDWEKQEVFKNSPHLERVESDYERKELSKQLRVFSLGLQENLRGKIKDLKIPLLWFTGEKDSSYTQMGFEISMSHPFSIHLPLKGASHRLLFEKGDLLNSQLKNWFRRVLERF